MSSISLCMIVKNEEQNIRRCLDSVSGFVKEMIIVDTGSSDKTKQICLESGAKVYDFRWTEDFSKARNFGIEKASCDWILWMDADEELCTDDLPAFQNVLETTGSHLIPIRLVHFYGPCPADEHRSYRSTGFRLFRNGTGISFTGEIHEKLDISATDRPVQLNPTGFLYMKHYGYMDENYRNKSTRNLNLLLKQKENHPGDPWTDYHLAAEFHRANEPETAFKTINLSIIGFLEKGLLPPSLAYKLKYEILVNTNSFDAAYPGIEKAVALYPDYVDLHFYKGRILYGLERYEEASAAFSHCLILGEAHPQYLIMSGTGSFHALNELGLCYEKQQKYNQAAEAYRQAVTLYPEFEEAKTRLQSLGKR